MREVNKEPHVQQREKRADPEVPRPDLQSFAQEAPSKQPANPLEAARADRQCPPQETSAPTARVDEATLQAQVDAPARSPVQRSGSTMRELRVKVWEETETVALPSEEKKPVVSAPPLPEENVNEEKKVFAEDAPAQEKDATAKDDGIEDLPTRPLTANFSPINVAGSDLPVQRASTPRPVRNERSSRMEEVERLDTARIEVQPQSRPAPQPVVERAPQQGWSPMPRGEAHDQAAFQGSPTPIPAVMRSPSTPPPAYAVQPMQARPAAPMAPPAQTWQQSPAAYAQPPTPTPVKRSRSRKPLVIALFLFCLLVLGGVGSWIFFGQSGDSQKSVQAKQAFSDATLGIALSYPSGWNAHADHQHGNASFYDSSHTAQMTVVTAPADGQDPGQYIQKEATGLGLTALKPGAPVAFAGASWQQVQGTVQQKGVTYSETLLVTVHGNHLFTLMQMALQSVYADYDQVAFSSMRATFHFL